MKTLVFALIAVAISAVATTSIARADGPCEQEVKTAVENQAKADKLGNVTAHLDEIPATDLNRMGPAIRVPVRDIEGSVIKSYYVLVSETCQVLTISSTRF